MITLPKSRLDNIVDRFETWLNCYVADGKNDCDGTFKQFKRFCKLKRLPFQSCSKILLENNISCDSDIILKYGVK